MSIQSFIERVCVQDAIYWEYDGTDGFSNPEFKDPVDIKVRWDEKTEVISDSNGEEYISHTQLLVPQDLKVNGYVKLGQVAELPAGADPRDQDGAFEIQNMERYPTFRSKTFDVFLAFL